MIRNWLYAALAVLLSRVGCHGARPDTGAERWQRLHLAEATPISDAVIVTSAGVIAAVGRASEIQIPPDARVIDCTGKTVVAGFWNSHVHFTEAPWQNAAAAPAASLTAHMQEMLTRWGFTTVWDVGSDPVNSLALRRRVNAGEVLGPNMFLAGNMFPKDGHPAYLPDASCPWSRRRSKPGSWRGATCRWARRHQAVHRRLQGRRQAGGEHGCGHRQGRGRCGACARQAGVRPSAKHRRH